MDQEQIFQKLMELERGQIRIQQALDMLLKRSEPKKWLDSCDIKEMFHISKSTLYRLKKMRFLFRDRWVGKICMTGRMWRECFQSKDDCEIITPDSLNERMIWVHL